MAVVVRRAARGDAERVARIHVDSFRATYASLLPPRDLEALSVTSRALVWTRRISQDGVVLVAEAGDGPRAFAWVGPSDDEDADPTRVWQLESIHVDPSAQGTGLGRTLLAAARAAMQEHGAVQGTLWVASDNERARRVYERDGWVADGSRRDGRLALPGESGPTVALMRMRRSLTEGGVG